MEQKHYIIPGDDQENTIPPERSSEIVAKAAEEIARRKFRTPKHEMTYTAMTAGMFEEQTHDDTMLVHNKHLQVDDLRKVLRIPQDPDNEKVLIDQIDGIVAQLNAVATPNRRVTQRVKDMLVEVLTRLSDVLARKEKEAKDTSAELPYEELAA